MEINALKTERLHMQAEIEGKQGQLRELRKDYHEMLVENQVG